ncbi:MAG: hypothetical protein CTY38_04850 [Methylotenera sp.]|uniref:hypothetical protein n=1 Tax=Methylotenera sp. TaxID=2051956 RepID=UPI000D47949D|nr:hypothetical protein [Methylotenera sp.]PPC83165.1 MAG: hypothetical protein CTY38_04850 [Methylotenera sp.]
MSEVQPFKPEDFKNTYLVVWVILAFVGTVIGLNVPFFSLNDSQILYLSSTSAQVTAGIYGLTLTGFLFFRTELSREASEDESLVEVIDELKSRYFYHLIYVSGLMGLTLALSNIVISQLSSANIGLTVVLLNASQSAYAVTLCAIVYFIFDVVSPRKVQRASQKMQDTIDPSREIAKPGNLESFLRNYNRIESLLQDTTMVYDIQKPSQFESRANRISNTRLVDFLLKSERISKSLYTKLRELITLRNAIIHGAEPVVSDQLAAESEFIKNELEEALLNNSNVQEP